MPDYRINISVDDNDSGRKVDELDKKLKEVTKPKKISLEFPNLNKVKDELQEVSKYSGIAVQAFKQFTPIGRQFAELEDNVKVVGSGLANVGRTLQGMSAYANPVRGIADGFGAVSQSIDTAIRTTANLGFAIFGVTQSVNVLKAAFGQAFEDTVGREVKLRESILQTATTLAGTNRVFAQGFEIKDPTEKLKVLEGSVNKSIERIRERSLEIAGTTSEAVIGVFNIVASQIGSFGGTMKQAEDLAVKFSGALGTLGMSDPGYARQEIGSIMMGNVTTDSALAKTIGISNADIQKARQQGKLYEYLTEKLAVFEAGQKIAAKGFAGITSNIQELQEELKRSFGASLLDPILKRIEAFYDKVSGKQVMKDLTQTARGFGQLIGSTLNTALGTVANAPVFKGIDSKGISNAAKELQNIFAKVTVYIQEQFARMAPSIQGIVDRIVKSVDVLGKAFVEVGGALARLKIDQIAIQLQAFSGLTNVILAAAKAYGVYLKAVEQVLSEPVGRYINELNATFKVLDRLGVIGFGQFIMAALAIKKVFPEIVAGVKGIATAIGEAFAAAASRVAAVMTSITGVVTKAVTTAITTVTVGILRILTLISTVAGRIEIALNVISTKLMLGGGILSKLAQPIYAVSQAFGQISVAAERAEVAVADLGIKGTIAMQRLQTGAQGAAAQVNGLGGALRGGVTSGAKAAGGAILGFGLNIARGIASMALWTVAITVVLDGLRRISEWWERMQQDQDYKQAIDDLNNGLLDQVKAARNAGKALDEVTEAKKRLRAESLNSTLERDRKEFDELVKELAKREANIKSLQDARKRNNPNSTDPEFKLSERQLALQRDPAFAKQLKMLEERMKETRRLINELNGITESDPKSDPQLKQQENRAAIEELAKFERDTRRSIEDEVYNYRRQAQDKELQVWRQQGELRIQRIASENQLMIDGVNSEARTSLEALNNWLSSKRRGELDIEAKKREAQMAAADLERALGKFRLNLEQQVAELRKRVAQYEFEVLDKRIKAEQLIANIRNGGIQMDSSAGVTGDTGLLMGRTGRATGDHWHVAGAATEAEARALFAQGAKAVMTSPPGMRRNPVTGEMANHGGWDLSGEAVRKLVLAEGYRMVDWIPNNGALGNTVVVERINDGKRYQLGHTAAPPANWTFFQGTGQQGMAPGTTPARNFQQAYFMRLSNLEGGYGVNGSAAYNPTSGARGYFQVLPSTERDLRATGYADMANGFRSKNYATAAKAAYDYAVLMHPEVKQLIAKGDKEGLDKTLNRLWPSLPGGSQAATGARLARAEAYMRVASPGSATQGTSGAASLASVGGAPQAPNLTLNIDTSELDGVVGRLKAANQQLIEMNKAQNDLNSEEGFRAFEKSLDTTTADLERSNKQVRDLNIDLKAVAEATKGGIYDPEVLKTNIKYQQGLAQLDMLRTTQLQTLEKFGNATAEEKARAAAKINEAYEKNKKNLAEIALREREALDIEKERQRLLDLNAARRQAQGDLLQQTFQLRSEARSALLAPDDFAGLRREQALQDIEAERLRLTENDTKLMSDVVKEAFDKFRKDLLNNANALADLDKAVNESRRIRELMNATEQNRIERLNAELTDRTNAAKAALDPTNFQGLRRLDAQQAIYSKYLEYTKGDTQPLTEAAAKELQRFGEQALSSADALAKVDAELQSFAERLALARDSARTITEGYKGMITSVMNGGSISEAVSQMGQSVAASFTEKILEYSFRPMEKQLEGMFGKLFGVDDAQLQNTNALTTLTTKVQELTTAITTAASAPAATGLLKGTPSAPGGTPSGDPAAQANAAATGKLADGLDKSAKKVNSATDQTLTGLQRYTTGLASVATAALSMAGGIQLMGKGGTYNTLMGLAGIFGSLGSVFGMFGGGGIFGARASGGPVLARQPYLVGERGPELFLPESDGRVVSNSQTSGMFQRTRAALAARQSTETTTQPPSSGTRPSPIEVRYEAQVINNVEYVTVEQHRKGMQEAARRGQMMAYQGMQHSVKVRRRLGL